MIFVGIDVASEKHGYYMMSHLGEFSIDVCTIENNTTGYSKLQEDIKAFSENTKDNEIHIALESTGHYSHNILHTLVSQEFEVMLINPLLTNMTSKSSSVRKTKTDKIDAKAICTFLYRNQKKLQTLYTCILS